MRTRWGMAAIVAAGLIVVGVMSTAGRAQATLSKMQKAVTQVTSSHLRVELEEPLDLGQDGTSGGLDITGLLGSGNSIDVWSEGNKWKAQLFGGFQAIYSEGYVTLVMADKVMTRFKVEDEDVPKDLGDFLFKELSKATAELKQHAKVRSVGAIREDGRTLQTLEVTRLQDEGRDFRMLYWVDEETDLPARFQLFARDSRGQERLVATITCEFNRDFPDEMFLPGADKP